MSLAVMILLLPLAAAPSHKCNIRLNQTLSGSCSSGGTGSDQCPGSWARQHTGCPWGCGESPSEMFTIRGCCGEFICNDVPVRCCSHQHLHPQLCQCGPPPPPPRAGGTFFVDPDASPGGDGTAAKPFVTVASCAAVATRASNFSTCRLAAGIYRESVVLEESDGLAIVGDGVGRSVLDGTLPLSGLQWTRHTGHGVSNHQIYMTELPAGPLRFHYDQLFVDGAYMTEARWPNAQLDTMLDRSSSWATMKPGSGWGIVHDPTLKNSTTEDWTGGRATLNLGTGVFTWVRTVQNFSRANGTFRFATNLDALKRPESCEIGGPCKEFVGNGYFLQGVLGALDAPGEWFLDTKAWVLYVWLPDGSRPSDRRLSVKAKDFCLRKQGHAQRSYVHAANRSTPRPVQVQNLSFHGCTFELLECENCSVTDVELLYPTYDPAADAMNHVPATTLIQGAHAEISRVHLAYSNNAGLMLVGSGHSVSEVLIESTCWLGSLAFPPLKIGFSIHKPGLRSSNGLRSSTGMPDGVGNTVTRSTVRGFGNSGIVTSQLSNEIHHTHVSRGGLIGGDDACIHADNAPVPCDQGANCTKDWHHNWVHDCREKCVRCDDGSRGCSIHHMVVFNCGTPLHNGAPAGILVKGDDNSVWDATIFNVSSAGQGDLVAITEFGQNKHSRFFNIAARRVDTRHGLPLSNASSCNFSAGIVSGDTPLMLQDPLDFQFAPTSESPLYMTGVKHTPEELAAHPNVGAYQAVEEDWRPGCTWHPRCSLKSDDAPVAWGTHGNFSTVQQCVNQASRLVHGGNCTVRNGVHRESVVVPWSRAGPITIAGAANGSTVFSGASVVTGRWVQRSSSNIYMLSLPTEQDVDQVFVDGEMAFEARWPDANLSSVLTEASWGVSTNSSTPTLRPERDELGFISDPAIASSGLDFTGALLTLNAGTRVWTWTRRVVAHTPGDSRVYFRGALMPEKGGPSALRMLFILSDLPSLLSENEWYLDRSASQLWLWVRGGGSPERHNVEIKRHNFCVSAPAAPALSRVLPPPVHLTSIGFTSCTFELRGCNMCSAKNISLLYPSHAREIGFRNFPRPSGPALAVTTLSGNDSLIEGLHLRHSSITGLLIEGNRNTARELLIESTNWFGSLDFPAVQMGFASMVCNNSNASDFDPGRCGHDMLQQRSSGAGAGSVLATPQLRSPAGVGNIITKVTVVGTGGGAIVTSQLANEISFARVVDATLIGLDQAGIHADNLGAHGFPEDTGPALCGEPGSCSKRWHHNWVFRVREKCVRGDDGTVDLHVHHNVIYDCGVGNVSSLSGMGSPTAVPLFAPRASPCGVMLKGDSNVYYSNTVWNTRGQGDLVVDTRRGPPCTEQGCTPLNARSIFLNSAQRRISTKGHGWRNGTFNASVAYAAGMVTADNLTALQLRDPARMDFRPADGSPLLGAGVSYPPFVLEERPDVGAYQARDGEERWVAGCTFHPRCLAQ